MDIYGGSESQKRHYRCSHFRGECSVVDRLIASFLRGTSGQGIQRTSGFFSLLTPKNAQQVARANAHRPSFFVHDSRARNSILALGERGSSLTLGKTVPFVYSFSFVAVIGSWI